MEDSAEYNMVVVVPVDTLKVNVVPTSLTAAVDTKLLCVELSIAVEMFTIDDLYVNALVYVSSE